MPTTTSRTSAQELGRWVRRELSASAPDTVHVTRVITQELTRWFAPDGPRPELADLTREPPDTGSDQWNAMIEGSVAHLMHAHGMDTPDWTRRTRLAENWVPNDIYGLDWHLVNVLNTPVELLDKGVVFARQNFQRL